MAGYRIKLIDNNCKYYYQTNDEQPPTNNDNYATIDTFSGRYKRISRMVFRSTSTITRVKSEPSQVQWENNGKSAVYVLDPRRSKGTRDGDHAFKYSDAASGGEWRYLRGTSG
jgi:hypothetical protein